MAKKTVQKKNAKPFIAGLVVIALVGVALLGYLVTRPKTQAATINPNIPAGKSEPYLLGKADAPIQVIEFGDFECPACGDFANVTEPDVRARLVNTGLVSFVYYDYPLSIHKNTWSAHIAASCAAAQGKFWEMHDRIYAGQDKWNGQVTSSPGKIFRQFAGEIGLDVNAWQSCADTQAPTARIKGNMAEGDRRNVGQTPTFFVGDKMAAGAIGYDQIKAMVDEATAKAAATKGAAAPAKKAPGE